MGVNSMTGFDAKREAALDKLVQEQERLGLYDPPPPQRKPLTVQEIAEFVGTHEYGSEQLKWFRFGEAAHGIKE